MWRVAAYTTAAGVGLFSAGYVNGYMQREGVRGARSQTDVNESGNSLRRLSALLERCKSCGLPTRESMLKRMQHETFDVVIIGGGATGAGAAVDATTRGLKVALIERDDFSSGTSSRSTKLIHGGVRYLEKAFLKLDYSQFKLVFEALHERRTLLDLAPHLATPLPIVTPLYSLWEVPYIWAGLKFYDLLAGSKLVFGSRYVGPAQTLQQFPMLARDNLKGSVIYYDGQFNDSRLNLELAFTAADNGAAVANHLEVNGLEKDPESGMITGAWVRDTVTNRRWLVRGRGFINATGPFADYLREVEHDCVTGKRDTAVEPPRGRRFLPRIPWKRVPDEAEDEGDDCKENEGEQQVEFAKMIQPAAGVHIILPDFYSPKNMGLIIPRTKDGRVVFMLPWLNHTIAGTTDSSSDVTALPKPSDEEVNFILDSISENLAIPVRKEDLQAAWSGLRPLARDPNATDTASVSRDHTVAVGKGGMVTIAGGKWTTYRLMAKDGVDRVVEVANLKAGPCKTAKQQLYSAQQYDSLLEPMVAQHFTKKRRLSSRPGYEGTLVEGRLNSDIAKHLVSTYGSRSVCVASLAKDYGVRISPYHPYLEAEVIYAVEHEYALTAIDVIARRTRLAFLDAKAAKDALPRVIELMAPRLRWSRKRRAQELKDALAFLETMHPSSIDLM